MSNVYDSLPEERPPLTLWAGIISTTLTDFTQLAEVTIPGIDPDLRWKNCRWQARNTVDLPHRGYDCLVAFDDNNEVWVVAWWPF